MVLTSNELCQILLASTLVAQIEPLMSSSGGVPGEVAKSEPQSEPRYAPTKELYTDAAFGSFGLLAEAEQDIARHRQMHSDLPGALAIFFAPRNHPQPSSTMIITHNIIFLSVKMPL